ncbi:MAG: DUF11 domain-containing protein [Candidatus Rokubacteria bacterium]|nr:DUF11 domain-containing protein [Candidatus Rokubacteria bacterium]
MVTPKDDHAEERRSVFMGTNMGTRLIRSVLIAVGLLALAVGLSGPASAAQPFSWVQHGGFTFGSESSTNGAGTGIEFYLLQPAPAPAATYKTIGWGSLGGASFVTGTDPFTEVGPPLSDARSVLSLDALNGTINDGETQVISHVTHANRTILPPFLTGVQIDTLLKIENVGGTEVLSLPALIPIFFTETINVDPPADGSGCDPLTHIATTPPCSDFFIFPLASIANTTFFDGSQQYSLTFGLVPGPGTIFEIVLCPPESGFLGLCARGRTAELSTNTIDITMTLNKILGPAQLKVAKSDGGIFLPGGQATYTIVVSNIGELPASNVVLTDALPGNGGLVWLNATPSQGSCTNPIAGNNLDCALGTIASGGSVTVTISSAPTTPLEACQSQPNPAAVAKADGDLEAEDSGSLICAPPAVFVIGDVEPHAIGNVVNFWGAQWWKNNFMSGFVSNGVASFKGYASQNDLFCGGTWNSRVGNSPPPPATIPEFVAIIVTDTVLKNGPNISGNIKEILLVHQDGGYGPNPGHRGNGPVVSIICTTQGP